MGDLPSEVKDAAATLRAVARSIEAEFNDEIAKSVFPDLDRIHSWLKGKALPAPEPTPSAPPIPETPPVDPDLEQKYDPTA